MITSPYNFVPLNTKIFFPEWSKAISQDLPFADCEDGWIEVEWRNDSPLFIRDTMDMKKKDSEKNSYSMHVMQPNGSRLYFLPGSSLKGMLRSVMSIMAFGKMDQYNNRAFGHREFNTKHSEGRAYQEKMQKVRYGWLSRKGEYFILEKCAAGCERIDIQQLRGKYGAYKLLDNVQGNDSSKISAWARNKAIKEDANGWFPVYTKNGVKYRIFATGKMRNKLHELLIPADTIGKIELEEDTKQKFLDIYAPTPDFDKFLELLEKGERIPVSYVPGNHGKDGIVAMGMGRMIRYPYKYDVKTLVEKEQKYDEKKKDLCETIFGWTDKEDALKGRVQISNAFAEKSVADSELIPVKGVFGSPKASFYPLYVKQTGGKYKTYEDANGISGRKQYRIHAGSSIMTPPQGNGDANTLITLNAIPAGSTFRMRVNVHNLKKVEVGALLSVITLHRQPGVWHNIGSGKSYGLGKLLCKSIVLHGLKYTEAEYLAEFELCMNSFLRKEGEPPLLDSPQLKRLMAIASEHSDNDKLKLMGLVECKNSKNNKQFEILMENEKELKSQVPAEEKFLIAHKDDYAVISDLEQSDNVDKLGNAVIKLKVLIKARKEDCLSTLGEERKVNKIEERINQIKAEASNVGLATVLTAVNLRGELTVTTWKICESKVKQWMKKKKVDALDEEAKDALRATIARLKSAPDKKEAKEWTKRDGKIWKGIEALLSQSEAEELYNK